MTSDPRPSLAALKAEAKSLRAAPGATLTHAAALEEVARRHGARDWNTLSARALRNGPSTPVMVGQRVSGRYLGQAFDGEVLGLHAVAGGLYKVTLHLDKAVDVVEFDSFSNWRQRISCTISEDGVSPAKRSDGTPHLQLWG